MMADSSKMFTYEAVIFTGKNVCFTRDLYTNIQVPGFTDKTMKRTTTKKRVKFAEGSVKNA